MDLITLKRLAKEIGMDRSHAGRFVKKLGLTFREVRDPAAKNQKMLALTEQDADIVRQARANAGFVLAGEQGDGAPAATAVSLGVFYIIQLVPELAPERVKLGFTSDLVARLAQHRTVAPTARVLRSWPCRRTWEYVAIDALSPLCKLILSEVFETISLDALTARADTFFSLLPPPDFKPPLSAHSPINT